MRLTGLPFLKGHGTENDFVLLPDPDGTLDLTPQLVRRLCDRRAGVGADGVLRVVRTVLSPEVAALAADAQWFMDYRNADGSRAEMCGNGVRVFARYLVVAGLAEPGLLRLATRHGVREVIVDGDSGDITVDMGVAVRAPQPVQVSVAGREYPAVAVDLGNPHAVVLLEVPVASLDLDPPPVFSAAVFPAGVNVELVNVLGPRRLAMRVVERGVGETRSCGTGAVAAAVVAGAGQEWDVDLPGGRLYVASSPLGVRLRGPAVLVAEGTLRPEWLRGS